MNVPDSRVLQQVMDDPRTAVYLDMADRHLEQIGYTEHGRRHALFVSQRAGYILERLGFPEKSVLLACTAGYLHDIGNFIGRASHNVFSAFVAKEILEHNGFGIEDTAVVMSAIGNHEEENVEITSVVTAAIIIADKADVNRTRVRNRNFISFDIHDRVNYAVTLSKLEVDSGKKEIVLDIEIDTEISEVVEYFEIFLTRMLLCKKAAEYLETRFSMLINSVKLI